MPALAEALATAEPDLVEPDWPGAVRLIDERVSQRALVVLLTTVDASTLDSGLLEAVAALARRHQVVIASVDDPEVAALATARDDAIGGVRRRGRRASAASRHPPWGCASGSSEPRWSGRFQTPLPPRSRTPTCASRRPGSSSPQRPRRATGDGCGRVAKSPSTSPVAPSRAHEPPATNMYTQKARPTSRIRWHLDAPRHRSFP